MLMSVAPLYCGGPAIYVMVESYAQKVSRSKFTSKLEELGVQP